MCFSKEIGIFIWYKFEVKSKAAERLAKHYCDMNIRLNGVLRASARLASAIVCAMHGVSHTMSRNFYRISLRQRLAVAALAALLTTGLLGTLLLMTANSARTVTEHAREIQTRVQAYSRLITTLRTFQVASYAAVQIDTPQTRDDLRATYADFFNSIDMVRQLPNHTDDDRMLSAAIARHGNIVTEHLSNIAGIVARIDEIWRHEGQVAAGLAAQQAAAPVRAMESLLNKQIREGDLRINIATERALALNHQALLACIVCLLLAAASWAIIHGLLLRRLGPGLKRLEESTLAFAAGSLDHRVRLDGQDELTRLGAAFDTMAEQLEEKQHALQQVQVNLERSVRERTEELEWANRELAVSDNRRRAFLADIGHELRTPLTIIRGEAQVALRTIDKPGFSVYDTLERIIKQTCDLGRMVDDLFLIAKAEAGGLPMQAHRTDLRELIERVVGDYSALAADIKAIVESESGPSVFWNLDPDRLRRALAALVDNALRHTQPGVHVLLTVHGGDSGVMISVEDDGPGIDPKVVPELFQRFRRGHTQGEGSGLGLSLARALVEAQSGRVRLVNRREGGVRAELEFGQVIPRVMEER